MRFIVIIFFIISWQGISQTPKYFNSVIEKDRWYKFKTYDDFNDVNGNIYELDGRKESPIPHGSTSQETFLKDSAKVVQKFMDRDPGEMRFTILALAPAKNLV